jgi:hypothetical protein
LAFCVFCVFKRGNSKVGTFELGKIWTVIKKHLRRVVVFVSFLRGGWDNPLILEKSAPHQQATEILPKAVNKSPTNRSICSRAWAIAQDWLVDLSSKSLTYVYDNNLDSREKE